jgi:hypothetical protein
MKSQRTILLFFVFFFSTFVSFGQYILSIQYLDKTVETEKIIKTVKFKKHYKNTTSIERDLQKLVIRLQQNGFNSASLDTIFIENNTCFAHIFIGNKLIINYIDIEGIEKEEIQSMKIKPDIYRQKSFSISDIFSYNDVIVNKLWNTGYPFATTKINELTPNDSGYTATISVEKSHFILLDSIIVAGNLKLGKSFLYGYLGLKRKKPYNESAMKQVPSRLQELIFADMLQPPGISFSDKEAALYIYANKQKTNQFDGFMGVVPKDEISGKILLTGSLTLDLYNVFTVGENMRFNWRRVQVLSQDLDIYMDFPYLFYSSFGIDGAFALEKKDTSYINMNFSLGVRYYLQQRNYVRAYYQFKNAHLINNSSLEYLMQLPDNIDYNSHLYGLEIVFSKLDYLFNPRKGYAFSFRTAIGQRNIIKNNKIADSLYNAINLSSMQLQSLGTLDIYIPIKSKWVWYIAFKAGHIQAYQLFENEIFRLGGLKTIRGFDQQSIYASTYGIINNELRFLFGKKSYLQAFFDAAWYECKLNGGYRSDMPFGFGVGISFDTKAGIFAFNYALGKQLNNPIRFDSGKITFGYTALF